MDVECVRVRSSITTPMQSFRTIPNSTIPDHIPDSLIILDGFSNLASVASVLWVVGNIEGLHHTIPVWIVVRFPRRMGRIPNPTIGSSAAVRPFCVDLISQSAEGFRNPVGHYQPQCSLFVLGHALRGPERPCGRRLDSFGSLAPPIPVFQRHQPSSAQPR